MDDDPQLLRNVRDELDWDRAVDHTAVHVIVQDGVAILSGSVASYASKVAAEKAARRAFGIKGVFDGITVRPEDPDATDAAVAQRVAAMLDLDALVPRGTVSVAVERGHATLTGAVQWDYQREAARTGAARVRGVTGVTCLVQVHGTPSLTDIRGRIVTALEHAAESDADAIHIELDGGRVRLSGRVATRREREIAEDAVRGAPGVTQVDDQIAVT